MPGPAQQTVIGVYLNGLVSLMLEGDSDFSILFITENTNSVHQFSNISSSFAS